MSAVSILTEHGGGCNPFALFALYYNFVRIHKTLRTTPAMAAGVTQRLWEIGDIVDILEAWEASDARSANGKV
jgi:hypothetical protein